MGKNKYIKRVAVCTRIVYGQATEQVHRSGCLKGTSGILFVLDDRNNFRTEVSLIRKQCTYSTRFLVAENLVSMYIIRKVDRNNVCSQ